MFPSPPHPSPPLPLYLSSFYVFPPKDNNLFGTMQVTQTLHSHPQNEPEHQQDIGDVPRHSALHGQWVLWLPRPGMVLAAKPLLMMAPLSAPHSPEPPFADRAWVSRGQFASFFHPWFTHDLIQEGFLVSPSRFMPAPFLGAPSILCSGHCPSVSTSALRVSAPWRRGPCQHGLDTHQWVQDLGQRRHFDTSLPLDLGHFWRVYFVCVFGRWDPE